LQLLLVVYPVAFKYPPVSLVHEPRAMWQGFVERRPSLSRLKSTHAPTAPGTLAVFESEQSSLVQNELRGNSALHFALASVKPAGR
jgi:hypothetical protein